MVNPLLIKGSYLPKCQRRPFNRKGEEDIYYSVTSRENIEVDSTLGNMSQIPYKKSVKHDVDITLYLYIPSRLCNRDRKYSIDYLNYVTSENKVWILKLSSFSHYINAKMIKIEWHISCI